MRTTTRLFLLIVAAIGIPFYWLLIANSPGLQPPQPVTIAQLRALAAQIPGPHPTGVEVAVLGARTVPSDLLAAGTGIALTSAGVMSFHLTVSGSGGIVIDSGFDRATAAQMGYSNFYPRAAALVQGWLRNAGLILLTHEHPDHLGGLAALGGEPRVMARALLAPAQLTKRPADMGPKWPTPAALASARRMSEAPLQAVAPGVAAIRAPGHTPGSMMYFVTLSDGREYLFGGDTVSLAASWQQGRARSHLLSDWIAPEDRRAVLSWLATVRALHRAAPRMEIVPGHDIRSIEMTPGKQGIVVR